MRILYLHQHFCPPEGAGNNRSYELGQEWQKLGHSVTIISGSGNFKDPLPFWRLSKRYVYNELTVIRLNVPYSHFMPFGKRIVAFVHYLFYAFLFSFQLSKFDIVYASSTPLTIGVLGVWCKWKLSSYLAFETVDLWPDVPIEMRVIKNARVITWLYILEKWIYQKSDWIVCLSEGMKDKIALKGIEKEKLFVAHNGSNVVLFQPSKDKSQLKRSLGFEEDGFVVLYAGTIGQANYVEFLVEVAFHVQESVNHKVSFLIIGDGNRASELRKAVKEYKSQNIIWLNTIEKRNVISYFQASDVGLVLFAPYKILETNSANKFFDYLACGLPVLINYQGWQKEYLDKHACGFSESNAKVMAQRIVHLASSPLTRKVMAESARKLAIDHFDRKMIAKQLIELFSKI